MKFLILAVLFLAASAEFPENTDPRIVNGQEAEPHQFPYQCALFVDGSTFCGCSILDAKTILTAAHCVDGARFARVVAGAHYINLAEESQQSIVSFKFIVHEKWDPYYTLANDIALVVLPRLLEIDGETVAAIDLYNGDSNLEDEDATVSGWGKISDNSNALSSVLRYTKDKIISNTECNEYHRIITPSQICLSGKNRRSFCNGDAGGPLVINNNGKREEVGIASFTNFVFCSISYPSAYTRISSYVSWINEKRASL